MVGHVGSPTRIVHIDMILTKDMKFQKLHFSKSSSSAILAWSSKMMVHLDSTGPSLQRVGARF